jgi:hypothetical protein
MGIASRSDSGNCWLTEQCLWHVVSGIGTLGAFLTKWTRDLSSKHCCCALLLRLNFHGCGLMTLSSPNLKDAFKTIAVHLSHDALLGRMALIRLMAAFV